MPRLAPEDAAKATLLPLLTAYGMMSGWPLAEIKTRHVRSNTGRASGKRSSNSRKLRRN
jgi:hypothetical protein